MKQARADAVLELLLEYGVDHIDTAAMYGDSELRLAPWLRSRRSAFFLATKTAQRTAEGARAELHRSLERLGVDHVDLIQLHNLVEPDEQQIALGPGGALEALIEARGQGLARFIGVTGHGTFAAAAHLASLARFDFDSVLLPYNPSLMASPGYAADFESLVARCRERNVAVQTIKAIARRRWTEGDSQRRFSWYEPIRDEPALARAVRWVLRRPGLFLNSSSDATLLPAVLRAASEPGPSPSDAEMAADARALAIEPLFVRGVSDRI
jgi:aryl-alcohol dehydrogenase-like predicted oxidoreductase